MNKVILMPISHDWKGTHAVSTSHGVVEFISTNNGVHIVRVNSKVMSVYSTLYQLVQYDPSKEELDKFLPIAYGNYRHAIKHVLKVGNKYPVGLSDKGVLHNIGWTTYDFA